MIARRVVGSVAIAILLGFVAGDARAGCTTGADATAVRRSLARQVRCNDKKFRQGPGATCLLSDAPACAGTLVTDAVALGYGPNNPPAAAVDMRALRAQLGCQKRIGAAISAYVGVKLGGHGSLSAMPRKVTAFSFCPVAPNQRSRVSVARLRAASPSRATIRSWNGGYALP